VRQPLSTMDTAVVTETVKAAVGPSQLGVGAEEARNHILGKHGGDRKSEERNQVDNINLKTPGGTQAAYLTARIARDNPKILERLKKGEFKSVRAAAVASLQKLATPMWLVFPRESLDRVSSSFLAGP
jgi:hypothetical protein